jgi:hypothetical protein
LNAALRIGDQGHGVPVAFVVFDAAVRTKAAELYVAEDDGAHAQVSRLTPDDGFESTYPDLALSGSRTALTWFDAKDGNEEVYLSVGPLQALVRPDALTGARVTNTKGHSIGAYAAWNGDRLGLAWCDDTEAQHEVYFAEFDAAGTRRGEVQRLSHTLADSLIPSIHAWRSGFAVAWNEYAGTGPRRGGPCTGAAESSALTISAAATTSGIDRICHAPLSRLSTASCALTKFTGLPSTVPSYSVVAITQAVSPCVFTCQGDRFPVICDSNSMSAGRWFASYSARVSSVPDSMKTASAAMGRIAAALSPVFIAA